MLFTNFVTRVSLNLGSGIRGRFFGLAFLIVYLISIDAPWGVFTKKVTFLPLVVWLHILTCAAYALQLRKYRVHHG